DSTAEVATGTYAFTNTDNTNLDSPATVLTQGTGRVKIEQIDLDLRRVTVTINWSDRGQAKSVALGTLIANL
ncbi:MAG: hypothetical protein H7Y17_07960, partial [Chlorobia bacterium]|nr:hypothetical protein [Fimbriimonadaceae bacterium]